MKTSILYITIFLAVSTTVYAQEDSVVLDIPQNKEEIQEKIESKAENIQSIISQKQEEVQVLIEEVPEEQKTKLIPTAQERVLKIITIVFERFGAFIVRYDSIVVRLENRILSIEQQGDSVEVPRELLEKAKLNLLESTALIIATKTELEKAISSETSLEAIRTSINLCRQSLQNTHTSLIEVITSIKANDIEETLSLE